MATTGAIESASPLSLPGPNAELLEAQARVCTGPHQARPLGVREGDPQPQRILDLILQSLRGELPTEEQVSAPQMGAFFAAMTIRRGFEPATNWSAAEQAAFDGKREALGRELPGELLFLMRPEEGCALATKQERAVVDGLSQVLQREHLSYEDTRAACEAVLNLETRPALAAALLIGQRMNLETYDELRGHLDAMRPAEAAVPLSIPSLTHFGQPYDGNKRYVHVGVFAAAARAAAGHPSVLHGVEELAPKQGITQEQILNALGAGTDLSLQRAAQLLEDEGIGFAYVSQREYAPSTYRLCELRAHIAKRPTWATAEKAQQLFRASEADHMIVGYYHAGYEERLLRLMWERGFRSGVVIKGEEGSCNYSLRSGKPSTDERKAINYTQGFRRDSGEQVEINTDVNPAAFGFEYEQNPRAGDSTPAAWAEAGIRALSGERGEIWDRIALNAAVPLAWTGAFTDADAAMVRVQKSMASGEAMRHLERYVSASRSG